MAASREAFQNLVQAMNTLLEREAKANPAYYQSRAGTKLEKDVADALIQCARGTDFDGKIKLLGGQIFPDIVVADLYGVEVKSTSKSSWISTGSSILESTRVPGVEHIMLCFGNLGSDPPQFISRPYEEVMSDIVVTHYPRYRVNMKIPNGETIFDKIGIEYDRLRRMENPVEPVSKYYRSILKPGQALWWAESKTGEVMLPPVLQMWSTLTREEHDKLRATGYAIYPELLGNSNDKYQKFVLWLVRTKSIVLSNVRDLFSAGGKKEVSGLGKVSATVYRIWKYRDLIANIILETDEEILMDSWNVDKIQSNRIEQWCRIASNYGKWMDQDIKDHLKQIFRNTGEDNQQ